MSVVAPKGFVACGVAAGIKSEGALDLAIVAAQTPVPAAAVFTTNMAAAAPVRLSRKHLDAAPTAQAVVLNSGCANAATGKRGRAVAELTANRTAELLGCAPEDILVCSTGMIGTHLAPEAVTAGVADALEGLGESDDDGTAAAWAIMTTDTEPKQVTVEAEGFTVGGMAKGAGMIRPDMATMLVVLTTDAAVESSVLDEALRIAVDHSFHALNVDGCPSTNDTVIALASGVSGFTPEPENLAAALTGATIQLARHIAADAEGASRVVTIAVTGAVDDAAARNIGRQVSDSALVRSSFYGADPNWGRIVGALGEVDEEVDFDDVTIAFAGTTVARKGVGVSCDEDAVSAAMSGDFGVAISVGKGPGTARVFTTDLTPDYVRFNAERS
ncbi:MAG: bifunctional glutamate N-acetyltransferase/amino-acid acetyltransferase ArgJ [Actinomycetota bacterium]|nr:bifunctional glutamate N-acetyltransferase/amino-acid acetyltransferase ArgJ [Actinomycetota bacterium]